MSQDYEATLMPTIHSFYWQHDFMHSWVRWRFDVRPGGNSKSQGDPRIIYTRLASAPIAEHHQNYDHKKSLQPKAT